MMYEYIRGTLTHIEPTYLVVETSGIGFQILAANPYRWQDKLNQAVQVYVEFVVRQDSQTLYGFKDSSEKQLFIKLNRVSGIGPKSALSILASGDHDGLIKAIESGDSQYLTKFPGVGKKTAQQMVLDLKGKLSVLNETVVTANQEISGQSSKTLEEVFEALDGLGYSQREINKIKKPLKEQAFETTQEALSIAFKLLLKN